MREDLTDITVVLDRSGSMASIRQDTIGGFNTFLAGQRKVPGRARISLVQFDDRYEPNYTAMDVREAYLLNESSYEPRGSTALLDAFGKTIAETGRRLLSMPESERPSKVVFVVVTDGHENASREYTKAKVKEMVEHQRIVYKWEFLFLGAGIDAMADAAQYGMAAAAAINTAHTPFGAKRSWEYTSAKMDSYRATGDAASLAFNAEERKEQEDLGAVKPSTDSNADPNSTATP